ncbi:hypothetical protein QBC36DRAFT_196396, partial [Triangularia setosa]
EVAIRNRMQTRHQISNRPIPAMLLEKVNGVPLHRLQAEELRDPRLLMKLQAMYDMLTEKGVVHGDPALHNFLCVDEGVVALDFEFSYLVLRDGITNLDEWRTLEDEIQNRLGQAQLPNPGSGFSARPSSPPIHSTTGAPEKKPTAVRFEDWWGSLPRP